MQRSNGLTAIRDTLLPFYALPFREYATEEAVMHGVASMEERKQCPNKVGSGLAHLGYGLSMAELERCCPQIVHYTVPAATVVAASASA